MWTRTAAKNADIAADVMLLWMLVLHTNDSAIQITAFLLDQISAGANALSLQMKWSA